MGWRSSGSAPEEPGIGVAEPKVDPKVRQAPRYKVFVHIVPEKKKP